MVGIAYELIAWNVFLALSLALNIDLTHITFFFSRSTSLFADTTPLLPISPDTYILHHQ